MIQIIPAISVYENKVARINHGNVHDITTFDLNPLDLAIKFQDHGIKRIHLIDLKGAQRGRIGDTAVLEMIRGYTDLSIDFGGGITFDDDIRLAFENGASTIHAATVAAKNKDLFSSWIISYGRNKIILSVDAVEGKIATKGWSTKTEISLMDLVEYYHTQGIQYVKCTDITKDGRMEGPPIDLYNKILNKFPDIKLMASGGIRSVQDIEKLQEIGVYGVIFAKGYYEGRFQLKDLEKFLI